MFNLRQQVLTYSFSNGLVRGLKQIPFYLGSVTFLVLHHQSISLATSQVFLYIFSLPKFFSFLFEILGGIFSYKLGPRGSFFSLSIGQGILSFSYILAAISFFMPTPQSFLTLFAITSFISQIGEALTSGSFEDCYERTIEKTNCFQSIEEIEVSKNMYIRLGQLSIAFFSTIAVAFYAKYNMPIYLSFFFIVGAIFIGHSSFVHLSWLKWSQSFFTKEEIHYTNITPQIIFFLKSQDIIFILSTGALYFIYIKFVTLGPLLSTNFLNEVSTSSISLASSISVAISSILIPLAGHLASKYISKQNTNIIFQKLCFQKGILLITAWATLLCFVVSYYPLPLRYNLVAIFILSFSFTPIYIWVEWLRVKICKRAIQNGAPIGENKSLFYSIITGSRELTIGLSAASYSLLIRPDHENRVLLLSILSFIAMVLFFLWAKKWFMSQKML